MDKVFAWIQENWATIVAAFDKLYAAIKGVIEGK
jgi:hypothetical protein